MKALTDIWIAHIPFVLQDELQLLPSIQCGHCPSKATLQHVPSPRPVPNLISGCVPAQSLGAFWLQELPVLLPKFPL